MKLSLLPGNLRWVFLCQWEDLTEILFCIEFLNVIWSLIDRGHFIFQPRKGWGSVDLLMTHCFYLKMVSYMFVLLTNQESLSVCIWHSTYRMVSKCELTKKLKNDHLIQKVVRFIDVNILKHTKLFLYICFTFLSYFFWWLIAFLFYNLYFKHLIKITPFYQVPYWIFFLFDILYV